MPRNSKKGAESLTRMFGCSFEKRPPLAIDMPFAAKVDSTQKIMAPAL